VALALLTQGATAPDSAVLPCSPSYAKRCAFVAALWLSAMHQAGRPWVKVRELHACLTFRNSVTSRGDSFSAGVEELMRLGAISKREGAEDIQLVPGELAAHLPLLAGFSSKEAEMAAIASASRLLTPAEARNWNSETAGALGRNAATMVHLLGMTRPTLRSLVSARGMGWQLSGSVGEDAWAALQNGLAFELEPLLLKAGAHSFTELLAAEAEELAEALAACDDGALSWLRDAGLAAGGSAMANVIQSAQRSAAGTPDARATGCASLLASQALFRMRQANTAPAQVAQRR